jgi:hypothetical protein
VVKQGGLKGILFDGEPYTQPYRQFDYSAQANRSKHTFTEYYIKARQRGREVMKAVSGEYPDITIMTYFLMSYPVISDSSQGMSAVGMHNRMTGLSMHAYGLLVGFIDGWLDVMPPTVRVVDGCERGYEFDTEADFLRAAVKMRVDAQELISAENRLKYRGQFQAGFGIFMDAHAFDEPEYPLNRRGLTNADLLRRDVQSAQFAADEYVWLWNEKGTFWPEPGDTAIWRSGSRKPWNVLMPGCDEALRAATDPAGYEVRKAKELVAEGHAVDIAQNGSFDPATPHAKQSFAMFDWETEHSPAYWSLYPAGLPQSSIGLDSGVGFASPGSMRIAGVQEGLAIQTYEVSPGQSYLIEAACRYTGRIVPSVKIEWMDSNNAWLSKGKAKYDAVYMVPEGKEGTWIESSRVIRVPDGARRLVLQLCGSLGLSQSDACWWDDVHVYRL